ncbi:hypothetical protein P7K49_033270 [Saguinus oedipus]|uniref:Uncharacterized protein n=1 Tax=Saguinus oedipus TaxID=9490 RepID=A0ABQ9TRF7_SAGOE|nr:hypothetical protein P7K49_033270 [Saguinus oedipus]
MHRSYPKENMHQTAVSTPSSSLMACDEELTLSTDMDVFQALLTTTTCNNVTHQKHTTSSNCTKCHKSSRPMLLWNTSSPILSFRLAKAYWMDVLRHHRVCCVISYIRNTDHDE